MKKKYKILAFVAMLIIVSYYLFLGAFQIAGNFVREGDFVVAECLGDSVSTDGNFVYSVALYCDSSFFKNSVLFTTNIDTDSLQSDLTLLRFEYIPHNIGLDCRYCSFGTFDVENNGHYVGTIDTALHLVPGDTIDVSYTSSIKTIWWMFGVFLGVFALLFYGLHVFLCAYNTTGKKWYYIVAIAVVLLTQCAFYIALGAEKQVYHCDEIFTYRLSNDFNYTPINSVQNAESYFIDKATVQAGEEFSYDKVYQNQVNDVHPPLYYFVFHTLSSFFPGEISKWFGLAINILFALATSFLLFALCNKLFKSKMISLITVVVCALGIGSAGTVMFLRMYSMMTFFAVLYVYLNVLVIQSASTKKSILFCLGLFATTFLGFMTHYYFVVFAGFTSVGFFVYIIIQNFKKKIHVGTTITYCISIFSGLALTVLAYPALIQHIFFSYRGVGTYTFNIQEKIQNLIEYADILASDFFISLPVAIILLAGICVLFFVPKVRKVLLTALKNPVIIIFTVICVLFVITIAVIAPYQTDRYMLCLYPIVSILLVYLFSTCFSCIPLKEHWILTTLSCFVLVFFTYATNPIEYQYSNYSKNIIEPLEPYTDSTIVVLTDAEWKLNTIMGDIAEFENFFVVVGEGNVYNELKRVLANYNEENLVVYIDNSFFDKDKHIRFAKKPTGLEKHLKLYNHEFFKSYVLFNN